MERSRTTMGYCVNIKSEAVQRGLKVSELTNAILSTFTKKFPSYGLEISPKANEVLQGKHDGLSGR
jgi:hypothetical protein